MDHYRTPIGAVRVDVEATRARHGAAASSGVQSDARSILFTSRILSHHRFVRVQRAERPDVWAFAEIRPSADGTDWASAGLLASLDVKTGREDEDDGAVSLVVLSIDGRFDKAKCKCSMGTVENVRVHFASRPRPSLAIVHGLQNSARVLMQGQWIWADRSCRVAWLNRIEDVELLDVEVANGSGCCMAIGTLSSSARVTVTFQNDRHQAGELNAPPSLEPVEEYTRRVEESLGGISGYAARIITAVISRLGPNRLSSATPVGAILSGLPGTGKTALAKAVCQAIGVQVRYLNAADVFQTFVGHSEAHIVKIFEDLVNNAPSILVVDGLESVAASRQGFLDSDSTLEVGVMGTFVACLEKLKLSNDLVFVLGTTSRLDDIDAAVYSNGRMEVIVRMEPPSQKERGEILERIMRRWPLDDSVMDIISRLSESTGGFVGADLLSLCQKTLQICINDPTVNRENVMVHIHHFDQALSTTYPSVLQAHHISLRQREVQSDEKMGLFSGVYGADEALKMISVSLLDPLEDCRRFLKFGTVPPKGILFTGPPGSGKTHLANMVATELRRRGLASFISIRCTDLLTKVIGDTEKSLRELFETARNAAPCVIYFDQIESIAPVRGFDTSTEQTFDRLLSMLLVEMDGFSTSRELLQTSVESDEFRDAFLKQQVVILASTNDKNLLDPAILRPGRFDVHIPLTLPDRDARARIFLEAAKQVPLDYTTDAELGSPDLLTSYVADRTNDFSANDLLALLQEAAMASMREQFDVRTVAIRFVRQALQPTT